MKINTVVKRVSIKLPPDFEPLVSFGTSVEVGSVLGYGTLEKTLESYAIDKNTKVLVDDGVYIREKEVILEKKLGLHIMQILSEHDGIVRLDQARLRIVDIAPKQKFTSPVRGRVVLITKEEILIETKFYVIPFFISSGNLYTGEFVKLLTTGKMISRKDVKNITPDGLKGLVILGGALTYRVFRHLLYKGITSFVVPYIDWNDYVKIFKDLSGVNLGVLQGLGVGMLWSFYKYLFANTPSNYIQADFEKGELYVPVYDIMTHEIKKIGFKDSLFWGVELNQLDYVEGPYYMAKTTGETFMLRVEEITRT